MTAILAIPLVAAALLALLPGYKLSARLNMVAALLTFLAALSLFFQRPATGPYVLVDDLNNVFIVLTTFVGFTTSAFSATYIEHELETDRLTPTFLRFYHAMYQVLMFAMNLALVTNNVGVMWVAIELATLTTVLMVGIYRTHEALEAAWKYFILGSVGIALALFGTILVYMAAEPTIGAGPNAMVWTDLVAHAASFDPALLNLAFVFLLLGYGTKVGLVPAACLAARCPCRRPDPYLGGLVRPFAERRALRAASLQDAARGKSTCARAGAADDQHGPRIAPIRVVHALPPARHQTHVCLFLDRAYGHRDLRLRHGRPARQFRRPLAHDAAFAHQVGDLLRRRRHRASRRAPRRSPRSAD